MSAPTSHDPLVVTTTDGVTWLRRAVVEGRGLYAVTDSCKCPEYLMATLAELAEHGIAGSADALPMPVGPEPTGHESLRAAYITALDNAHKTYPCPVLGDRKWSGCVHYDEAGRIVGVGSCHSERRADAVLAVRDVELEALRARVAELEARDAALLTVMERVRDMAGDVMGTYDKPSAPGCSVWGLLSDLAVVRGLNRAPEHNQWSGVPYPEEPDDGAFEEASTHAEFVLPPAPGPSVDELTRLLAPTQALREDGAAAKCRCDEPDADPYECEADDCSGYFSELNPFGGGPVHGHDAKVSRTCGCGWTTSVWHVADGSAEAELHDHVTRVHGGTYPQAETGGAS